VRDRQRPVEVGLLREFGRDESHARHGAHGLEHAGVRDADEHGHRHERVRGHAASMRAIRSNPRAGDFVLDQPLCAAVALWRNCDTFKRAPVVCITRVA
jgi:hypothetical protein